MLDDGLTDEKLAVTAVSNEDAFRLLMGRYEGLIRHYARKINIKAIASSDAVQEMRIAFFNCVRSFDPSVGTPFSAYLIVFFKRTISNLHRDANAVKRQVDWYTVATGYSYDDYGFDIENCSDQESVMDPAEYLIMNEMSEALNESLENELSELEKTCLQMFAYGYNGKEIAENLSSNEKKVYNAIERARKKLRKLS